MYTLDELDLPLTWLRLIWSGSAMVTKVLDFGGYARRSLTASSWRLYLAIENG